LTWGVYGLIECTKELRNIYIIISAINCYVPIMKLEKYLLRKNIIYCHFSFIIRRKQRADEIPYLISLLREAGGLNDSISNQKPPLPQKL